ncbi:MAG: 50S ribosomal protein L18e [Candidatus Pacearchaeota archaeon]|nr:50S ribosomal protein L18e [Candidatus Pacearchaeota archaeon]
MKSRTSLEKRKKRKSNPEIVSLVNILKKQKTPLFDKITYHILKPRKKAVTINIEKINKFTKGDEVVIVPGKVLGKGELDKKNVAIVALKFSKSAEKKLEKANLMSFEEFIRKREAFKGFNIKIMT